jgi:DNA-binding response OmpR family regulator
VLIARRDDRWLATWSQADAVVPHPIDAPELTEAVAELLRRREAGLPVRRAVH